MKAKEDLFYKILVKVLAIYKIVGVSFLTIAFVILLLNTSPSILYSLDSSAVDAETELLISTVEAGELDIAENRQENAYYTGAKKLPAQNPNLPKTPTLIIKKIGVQGVIYDGSDAMAELEKGIWRDPDLGNPTSNLPTIVASHRFGYAFWSQDFRDKNSFYNLPQLVPGDEIIFIWDQREFKYKVTATLEDTQLRNVSSDLVLYTCKFFRDDIRFIVYADLVI